MNSVVWRYVEEIILKYRDVLEGMMMRDAFYFIRDILSREYLSKGLISNKDIDHYSDNYDYLRDDLFVRLEREEKVRRPEVKEYAEFVDGSGEPKPIHKLPAINLEEYMGIIFVEKEGAGRELQDLARLGFIIIPSGGKGGFPQRVVRWAFKQTKLPVLVLHDCDVAGEWIYTTFFLGSRRTMHLDLKIEKERIIDLGLTLEDVKKLDLPPIPEAKKFRRKRSVRWELSSLSVLTARHGIQKPLYAYVIAKLLRLGIKLKPKEKDKITLAIEELAWNIERKICNRIREYVAKAVQKRRDLFTGKACGAEISYLESEKIIMPELPELEKLVEALVENLTDKIVWITGETIEKEYMEMPDVRKMGELLR